MTAMLARFGVYEVIGEVAVGRVDVGARERQLTTVVGKEGQVIDAASNSCAGEEPHPAGKDLYVLEERAQAIVSP